MIPLDALMPVGLMHLLLLVVLLVVQVFGFAVPKIDRGHLVEMSK